MFSHSFIGIYDATQLFLETVKVRPFVNGGRYHLSLGKSLGEVVSFIIRVQFALSRIGMTTDHLSVDVVERE